MTGWFYDLLAPPTTPAAPVIQESAWDAPFDPDMEHSAANLGTPYVRKLTTKPQRDIPELTYQKGIEYAYYLSVSNPLAKGALKLTKSFVCGDGITVAPTDPEKETDLQAVLERFWDDERNHMDMTLPEMVYELGLFGEQIPTVFVNPVDGHVRLGVIDPADVQDIICEPGNITHPIAVELKQVTGQNTRQRYKIIEEVEDVKDPWYGRLKGVAQQQGANEQGEPTIEITDTYKDARGEDVPYMGACFLFQINKVRNRKRGQSDLMDLLDWIDAYGQLLFNDVDRALLMKAFIWDVAIDGGPQEIEQFKAENKTAPQPGSVRVHTNKVEWKAPAPDLKTHDTQMASELLLALIGVGSGLPKHWLGAGMDINRSTAESMDAPSIKVLTERQQFVKFMVLRMARFVLDQAEMANRLPKRKAAEGSLRPEPWPIAVNAPEIATKDLKALSATFTEMVQALSVALADKAIDLQTYQDLLAFVAQQLGFELDLEEMRVRLEEQQAVDAAQAQEDQQAMMQNGNGNGTADGLPGMQDLALLARGN